MTVKEIFNYLNNLFPVSTANDYDNPGILVGNPDGDIKKAVIALDCTLETVAFAKDQGANVIITHHPIIFSPLKKVLKGSAVYELIRNDIAVISMHTNLDVGENGVNDCLAEKIGLSNIAPHLASDGYLLKYGFLSPVTAKNFADIIAENLEATVKYVDGGKEIEKVLVCSGSGGDFIEEAIEYDFDALVTADIKHHHFLMARDNGVSLFDAGHFSTEDIIVEDLSEMLSKEFPACQFLTYHPDIIKFAYIEN